MVNYYMKRKLIQQGRGGFTLTVPIKWVEENKLRKGDDIEINQMGPALTVTPSLKKRLETEIEINNTNKVDLRNILTHLYRRGYDIIHIKVSDQKIVEEIEFVTNNILLGFEVVSRSSEQIIIENISEPSEDRFEVMLRRLFLLVQETHSLLVEDLKQGKYSDKIKEFRDMHDKYVIFCMRIIKKGIYKHNPALNWELIKWMMRIEHAYFDAYDYAAKNKITSSTDNQRLLLQLKDYYQLFYDSYYHKNMKSIHKIREMSKVFQYGNCFKLIEKSTGKDAVFYSLVREIFRYIQVSTSPILSLLLEEKY